MGIDLSIAKHFLNLSQKVNFKGRMLMLGRQQFHVTHNELNVIADQAAAMGMALPSEALARNDMFAEPFFEMLGFDVCESLDASRYENCTHVHDLGAALPSHLSGVFDFVFDGGTTEHIFDQAAVCKNVYHFLKSDGCYCSVVPANGYFGHGFYQFGPEFPWSFWHRSCGLDVVDCIVLPKNTFIKPITIPDPESVGGRVGGNLGDSKMYLTYVVRKTSRSQWLNSVQQSDYVATWNEHESS